MSEVSLYASLPALSCLSVGQGLPVCLPAAFISQTVFFISFRKSTPPQNRQLNISVSNSEQ
jgi:hypothetical protein